MAAPGFRPQLLPLEDRLTPAGDVTARVVNGTLFIDGDERSNAVTVAGTGWRSVAIRPGDADTTINGRAGNQPLFIGDIFRGIVIRTNDGEDTVRLENIHSKKYIGVFTGGGEDEVVLAGLDARGAVEIDTGVADDLVRVTDSKFRRTLAVNLGDGDDQVDVSGSKLRARTFFVGGEGTDAFGRANNKFTRSVSYTGFETVELNRLVVPPTPSVPPDDGVAPTVVISSSAGESTPAAQVPFRVTFSEPVTGFDVEDMGVTNGTPTNFTAISATDFTFAVIPAADGAITVSVPGNVAFDATGLGNADATPLTVRSIRTDAGMTNTVPNVNDPNFVPTGSGLAVWDVQVGSGTAVTAGNTVQVFYTGWLTNGTVFDQARTTGQPASFPLSNLIAGFREGMIGMQPGGIRRFRIPPELGYGAAGTSTIPPNSTLIFEVKLVAVS
jgi:FKBP-type peptidyl-prolyl cis-trans isomerase FkpA